MILVHCASRDERWTPLKINDRRAVNVLSTDLVDRTIFQKVQWEILPCFRSYDNVGLKILIVSFDTAFELKLLAIERFW